jgi:hypothetical protein
MRRFLRVLGLSSVSAAQGASTPSQAVGIGLAWSTTISRVVTWTGAAWTAIGGLPQGTDNQLQYKVNAIDLGGAANLFVSSGDLELVPNLSPTAATAGRVKVTADNSVGFPALETRHSLGPDTFLGNARWHKRIMAWNPIGNATTAPTVEGIAAATVLGTATARNVANTNLLTRTRRLGYVSAATAGALCGHYFTVANFTVGNGSGVGGFFYSCRFAPSVDASAPTGVRAFVGVSSSVAAPTNVEPSTLTNCVGIAQLSTSSTQLYLVYGGTNAQTAVALDTNFPPNNSAGAGNGAMYELSIYSPPNSNGVLYVRLHRLGTNFIFTLTITPASPGNQTPQSTIFLAHRAWRCNNAQATAVGIDIAHVFIETDY